MAGFFANGEIGERSTATGWSLDGSSGQCFGNCDPYVQEQAARFKSILQSRYGFDPGASQEDLLAQEDALINDPRLAAMVGGDRFLTEIKTTANLQHPHILPLHDSGEADGLLYYVMPYVEGESLRGRLDREQQLPIGDAVRIATKVAGALEYAHGRGVIHRDIKPANLFVSSRRGNAAARIRASLDVPAGLIPEPDPAPAPAMPTCPCPRARAPRSVRRTRWQNAHSVLKATPCAADNLNSAGPRSASPGRDLRRVARHDVAGQQTTVPGP